MARPLKYDDQFISILSDKLYERFFFFTVKVQSTSFCQKLNLQQALFLSGIVDFFMGFIVFLLFFKIIGLNDRNLFFAENVILVLSMIFGLLGLDAASNLKKRNSNIYLWWKYFITFYIPISEAYSYNSNTFCYYNSTCSPFYYFSCTTIYLTVNLYFTKIAWSFCVRLHKNHELLVIHGKYLEKMMNEESYKINDVRKFLPKEMLDINIQKHKNEKELLTIGNTQHGQIIEDVFEPKSNNPFLKALKNIKKTSL